MGTRLANLLYTIAPSGQKWEVNIWGVFLSDTDLKKFRLRRAKIVFFVFLKLKIFSLRRAKNRVLCVFRAIIFPPAAGIQQNVFPKSFYEHRSMLLLFAKTI